MKALLGATLILFLMVSCQEKNGQEENPSDTLSKVKYAQGFQINSWDNGYVIEVMNPWKDANKSVRYVLHRENAIIPKEYDGLAKIQIPVSRAVYTSTTHIGYLQVLNSLNTIVGFANPKYISSAEVQSMVSIGQIQDVGLNLALDVEKLIELKPDVLIGFAVDAHNAQYDFLEKANIPVVYNGDWLEQTPLGKAEWLLFFGALFDKLVEAEMEFKDIVSKYEEVKKAALTSQKIPSVMSGALYNDLWDVPGGNSWGAYLISDANAKYIWSDTQGAGSLSLSFEDVLAKAINADFWINPSGYDSLEEMILNFKNYKHFKAFKKGAVYSMYTKKNQNGGVVFYEESGVKPDVMLKDLVKVFHPELFPDYSPYFLKQIN